MNNMQMPNQLAYPQKKEKARSVDFTIKDYAFYGIFAAVTLFTVFTGLFGGLAAGFAVSSLLLILTMTVYLFERGRVSFLCVSSAVIAAADCIVFFLYGGDFLTKIIAFATLVASGVIYTSSLRDETVLDSFAGVKKMLYGAVPAPAENLAVPIRSVMKDGKKKTVRQILLGAAAAIPVLAVIIPLLTSSDAAFEGLVSKVASAVGLTVLKIAVSVVLFLIISAYAVVCRFDLSDGVKFSDLTRARRIKLPFAVTFLSALSFVYLVYMFSQTAYFFSAFSGILPEGYTFSFAEYARRGFFETEAIASINLIIMSLLLWLTKRKENDTPSGIIKVLLTFMSAFTVLFIATAISKMIMYIGEYSLTRLRLFTSVFMLATAAVVIAFTVRVFNPKIKSMKYAVVVSMALFTALSLSGIDRTVADYNVSSYLNGKTEKIDTEMFIDMSDSVTPYLVKLAKCDDGDIRERAEEVICCNYPFARATGENWAENEIIAIESPRGFRFTLSEYFEMKALNGAAIKYTNPNVIEWDFDSENTDYGSEFDDYDIFDTEDETVNFDNY